MLFGYQEAVSSAQSLLQRPLQASTWAFSCIHAGTASSAPIQAFCSPKFHREKGAWEGGEEKETREKRDFSVTGRNWCFSEHVIFMENINQLSSKSSELRKWSGREKAAMWPDVMYF